MGYQLAERKSKSAKSRCVGRVSYRRYQRRMNPLNTENHVGNGPGGTISSLSIARPNTAIAGLGYSFWFSEVPQPRGRGGHCTSSIFPRGLRPSDNYSHSALRRRGPAHTRFCSIARKGQYMRKTLPQPLNLDPSRRPTSVLMRSIEATSTKSHRPRRRVDISEIEPVKADQGRLIGALQTLFDLLEDYAPSWYTQNHHIEAATALAHGRKRRNASNSVSAAAVH